MLRYHYILKNLLESIGLKRNEVIWESRGLKRSFGLKREDVLRYHYIFKQLLESIGLKRNEVIWEGHDLKMNRWEEGREGGETTVFF